MSAIVTFQIPMGQVLPVDDVDVRLDDSPHPFEIENADAIENNWRDEVASNPALYDGRLMLHSHLAYQGRKLVGRCHEVRYATLLYWRRDASVRTAQHAYAHAALVSRDNALIAIRMGPHTAGAGRVYFAAGSFEPPDFPRGRVDIDSNMAREVREETGLEIAALERDHHYHLYSGEHGTVIFRRYYLRDDADLVAAKIRDFVAAETEPEIEGPVIIKSADERPAGIMPFMVEMVKWHFSLGGRLS